MPLTYEVCQLRDTGYTASSNNTGGLKSVQIGFTAKYLVKVSGASDPNDISDLQVAYAPGIPLVNYNTYYHAASGLGYPLAVCSSKTVKRLSENGNVFHVDVTFQTDPQQGGGKNTEVPSDADPVLSPPPLVTTDITPQVSFALTDVTTVLSTAPGYDQSDVPLKTPNVVSTDILPSVNGKLGVKFETPVTKRNANVTLTITQFESTWDIDSLLDRGYKVNDAAWGVDGAKLWMITGINAVKQSVTVDDGAGGTAEEEWYRVTYTLERNDYSVSAVVGGVETSLFVGHQTALPLYSTHYLDTNQVPQRFLSESGEPMVGKVDADGDPLADQTDPPHYVRFDTVDEISFSFLQWSPS